MSRAAKMEVQRGQNFDTIVFVVIVVVVAVNETSTKGQSLFFVKEILIFQKIGQNVFRVGYFHP